MPLFVIFVFGAILLGAGAMLAPALPSRSPRIGLAAALVLALLVVGSIGYATLVRWNTLVIDYLWFALLVGIFLTGTLSAGMFRHEAEGGTKEYAGWPGPLELAFFAVAALMLIAPAVVLPVPLDTDAQGFGYLALSLKLGGSLTSLAPYHPEIHWLYSPGLPTLIAYLGSQLNAPFQNVMLGTGTVFSFVFVWIAYDFGNEVMEDESRRAGLVSAVCALIGTGLLTANLDSHYSALMALVFALAFLTFAIRYHREGRRADFIAAIVTLAGVPLSQPDMTIILALGYVPWLVVMWAATPRPTLRRWLGLAVGIPGIAILLILPWIVQIAVLLRSEIQSPFEITPSHLLVLVAYHGGLIVLLALVGIVARLRLRNTVDLLMLVWLLLVIDFSSFGILKTLLPFLFAPITRYDYPFSIAWHGPIIPYLYFGTRGTLWLIRRIGQTRVERWARSTSLPLLGGIALAAAIGIANVDGLLAFSKTLPFQLFGAFSSKADLEAMRWLRDNTPPGTLILNYPGAHEGHWVPVIAQRNSVYFRSQPFFRGTKQAEAMQNALLAFWRNPADPANANLLRQYGIQYVIVPQLVTSPDSLKSMFRWRPLLPDLSQFKAVSPTPFFRLVFDQDGAQVYRLVLSEEF